MLSVLSPSFTFSHRKPRISSSSSFHEGLVMTGHWAYIWMAPRVLPSRPVSLDMDVRWMLIFCCFASDTKQSSNRPRQDTSSKHYSPNPDPSIYVDHSTFSSNNFFGQRSCSSSFSRFYATVLRLLLDPSMTHRHHP